MQSEDAEGFATSDLAEALAGPGGPAQAQAAVQRLEALQSDVAGRIDAGVGVAEAEAYRTVAGGLAIAKALMIHAATKGPVDRSGKD